VLPENLNPDIRGGLDTLFERNGILSTTHGRITLSAALRWIDKPTYQDLHLLRDIRNRFAHRVSIRSFSDNPVRGYIASMSHREDSIYKNADVSAMFRSRASLSPREIYMLRAIGVVDSVCMDFIHLPAARAHQVHPTDMFKEGFEAAPEWLRNLKREVARFYSALPEHPRHLKNQWTRGKPLFEGGAFLLGTRSTGNSTQMSVCMPLTRRGATSPLTRSRPLSKASPFTSR
jgi:hypothetical protein